MPVMNFYQDYSWKRGRPVGIGKKFEVLKTGFKVVSDPYFKRISVERYEEGLFKEIVYDSALFDFRLLRLEDAAWQREVIKEENNSLWSVVRNIEDRIIFIEVADFQEDKCIRCKILSSHLIPIATQLILDESRGDPWNGVVLQDIRGKTILQKKYAKDPVSKEFGALLEESWDSTP